MAQKSFSQLKVLVVEDNGHARALLKSLLKSLQVHDILEATDAEKAFEILQTTPPNFILSDLAIKPVDGIAFTRRVRTAPDSPCPHIPIIMITAITERKIIEAARDAGVTELLAKPVTAQALGLRIAEIVERPRAFLRSSVFTGPDRRRRGKPDYSGPKRRSGEAR